MALDFTGLMTVLGKDIKQINTMNGYFAALETAKDDIYTVLAAEGLQDSYASLPGTYLGFYSNLASWIQSLIGHAELILTDEEYVLDELPIFSDDVTTVLNALHAYMVDQAESFKASIVTLATFDLDQYAFVVDQNAAGTKSGERGFVTRMMDGVNAPTSLASANPLYNNVEGQLAMPTTVYAKVISSVLGAETLQLFGDSPAQASYTYDAENPGVGPSIANAEASNLLNSNADFSAWSGDNPTNWTLAGGSAGTDWEDESGTGEGPLKIMTAGVALKQQLTNLERRRMYFIAFRVQTVPNTATNSTTWKLRVENVDGVTVHKSFGSVNVIDTVFDADDKYRTIYGFYSPSDTVNLDDIYVALEYDAETEAGDAGRVFRAVVAPAVYFNGCGWAFWNPYEENETTYTRSPLLVDDYGSIAIGNGNQGVFQTFFRKAFNVQLPTDGAGTHTVNEALAT